MVAYFDVFVQIETPGDTRLCGAVSGESCRLAEAVCSRQSFALLKKGTPFATGKIARIVAKRLNK